MLAEITMAELGYLKDANLLSNSLTFLKDSLNYMAM